MAAITGTVIAGISTATAIASTVDGISKSNKAEKALDNLQTPEYDNPNREIKVSTAGSDLIKEEGQRTTANILNGMQGGSARTMLSGLPQLASFTNDINQKAALNIDSQMEKREYAIAGYEERLNGIEENRYQGEIAGLGAMYNSGQHQMWNGIKGTISGAGSSARAYDDYLENKE
tara:strand:- start:1205 stop:1732 length:528 start_codon:yes stop_codon:yes gene_type:complete